MRLPHFADDHALSRHGENSRAVDFTRQPADCSESTPNELEEDWRT